MGVYFALLLVTIYLFFFSKYEWITYSLNLHFIRNSLTRQTFKYHIVTFDRIIILNRIIIKCPRHVHTLSSWYLPRRLIMKRGHNISPSLIYFCLICLLILPSRYLLRDWRLLIRRHLYRYYRRVQRRLHICTWSISSLIY